MAKVARKGAVFTDGPPYLGNRPPQDLLPLIGAHWRLEATVRDTMRKQWELDRYDYVKYLLVGCLARRHTEVTEHGRFIVCWMLTPSEATKDFQDLDENLAGRLEDAWNKRQLRTEVFGVGDRTQSLCTEEKELPHSDAGRKGYFADLAEQLQDDDLVFFDPDTGLTPPKGARNSPKHLHPDDATKVVRERDQGHRMSVCVYQHHRRRGKLKDTAKATLRQLCAALPDHRCFALVPSKGDVCLLVAAAGRHTWLQEAANELTENAGDRLKVICL